MQVPFGSSDHGTSRGRYTRLIVIHTTRPCTGLRTVYMIRHVCCVHAHSRVQRSHRLIHTRGPSQAHVINVMTLSSPYPTAAYVTTTFSI